MGVSLIFRVVVKRELIIYHALNLIETMATNHSFMFTLYQVLPRRKHRDWASRWRIAGESVKWEGASKDEFSAEESSPIWAALYNDFEDSTHRKKPPFFFNSGMGLKDDEGNVYFDQIPKEEEESEEENQEIEEVVNNALPTLLQALTT